MKIKYLITAAAISLVLLTGCTLSSGTAIMKAESLTENGWQMSVQSMSGTDVVNLNHAVKGEACTARVAVGVDKGSVTIEFRDNSGNAVYTSEKLTASGTVTAELDGSAYKMAVIAEEFGGTIEAEIVK